MNSAYLAGMIGALIFSIFFSGMEVSILSLSKLSAGTRDQEKTRDLSGRITAFFTKRPTWFIGTTLIGNIGSLILFGVFTTLLLFSWFDGAFTDVSLTILIPIVTLTFVLSVVILYTVELFSKSFFIINAGRVVRVMAIPFAVFFVALFPLVFTVISLAKLIIDRVFGLEYSKQKPVFGLTDVNEYLKTMHRIKPGKRDLELDEKIFKNALEFKSVRIRDCMIPRTEITAVGLDTGLDVLREAFLESGHSKIIIFKDSIDDIVGYCHSAALFKKPSRIEEILTPIITIPETALAKELMVRFINERKSLAAVVDEFGGTSGIVSMEDVIEEIFGEIEDEHDEDTEIELQIDSRTWLLSARLEIDYLNETYDWNLPTGDYDTLGGLILSSTEDLPKSGETVNIPPATFVIQSTAENRINTVRLILDEKAKED